MNKEQIQYIEVEKLMLNEKNPRINDGAVDTVIKSITKYGFKNPLIVDKNLKVYCGNTRLKAAIKMGLKEVPVIIADDLTEKQIREYAIIDNKSNEIAEWDYDALSVELEDLELDEFGELFTSEELDVMADSIISNQPKTTPESKEKKEAECPNCGCKFTL